MMMHGGGLLLSVSILLYLTIYIFAMLIFFCGKICSILVFKKLIRFYPIIGLIKIFMSAIKKGCMFVKMTRCCNMHCQNRIMSLKYWNNIHINYDDCTAWIVVYEAPHILNFVIIHMHS